MLKYKIQSILFDKTRFSVNEAINWLIMHNYKVIKCHETSHYWRFRQENPEQLKKEGLTEYRNMKISGGIVYVIAFRK
jgi:hypothetical protein